MKKSRISDRIIVLVLITVMMAIIIANTFTFFSMSSKQTEEIGSKRIEGIRDDLQFVLVDAQKRINLLAYETDTMMAEGVDRITLKSFIENKKNEIIADNENIISIFCMGSDWRIIPGFDDVENFDRDSRIWYQELKASGTDYVISSTYQDYVSEKMCFTIAKYLSDGDTIVGIDYYLTNVQDSITDMCREGNGDALIVDSNGTIVGYTDESKIGKNVSEVLPEYENALHLARKMSVQSENYELDINGKNQTVFCTKTENDWYLIYRIDSTELYGDTYIQMLRNTFLYIVFAVAIIVLYLYSNRNRKKAEKALLDKEEFLHGISNEFKSPLINILQSSDYEIFDKAENKRELLESIKESGLKISTMVDNLFSYSVLFGKEEKKEEKLSIDRKNRIFQIALISTVFVAMGVGVVFSIDYSLKLASDNMQEEVQSYSNVIENWTTKQKSILDMFTTTISENPQILDDYDTTVEFLDGITKHYDEISVSYITNPAWDNYGVRMNNDWRPDASFVLTDRQWYKDTFENESGMSISYPYYDAQTGIYCITFSKIVYDEHGNFLGVLGLDCYLDKLVSILGDTYGDAGYAFLVDGSGTIINHPHDLYELTENESTSVANCEYNEIFFNTGKIKLFKDFDGNLRVGLAKHEEVSDLSVITVKNFMYIYGSGIIRLSVLFVIFLICIALIAWIMRSLSIWQNQNRAELERAVEAAVEANESQAQFFAQMSHEIRTPINAVLGMNEMILRENEDPDIEEYAMNINGAGQTLLQIINNLLEFSKLQNGKLELASALYDTDMWITGLVHMVSESAAKKDLKFALNVDPKLPRKLYGDDTKLTQVVINLLSNAVKYTQEGSVTLNILCAEKNEDSQTITMRVEVVDTGIGIRKEDMEALFTAFKRLDLTKNHGIEGTGLGVTIVNKFLNMMGSELKVDSVYGKGSNFYFEVVQRMADATELGEFEVNKSSIRGKDGKNTYLYCPNAKILIVDDNEANLNVAKNLLKRSAAKVTLAASGAKAIEILREDSFDIVFMDHMMPQMDGIETLHRIMEQDILPENTTVIALTANAIAGAKEMYLNEGFENYLSKPIQPAELEQIIERYLPKNLVEKKTAQKEKTKKASFVTIEDVDVNKGMEYMQGDEALYLDTLTRYYKSGIERESGMSAAIEACDWPAYKIESHTLKSNSYNIGADKVGDLAKALEHAASEEDANYIVAEHSKLVDEYNKLLANIKLVLEEKGIALEENKKDMTLQEKLKAALDDFEQEEALEILEQIPKEQIDEQVYAEVLEMIENFNYSDAAEIVVDKLFMK